MENPLKANEILHSGEGRDVERWLESRNNSFVFAIACVLLSIFFTFHTCVVVHLTYYHYLHFIHHFHYRSILISTRRQLSISTHTLEELRGEVLEPFTENSASIFVLTDRLHHSS